MKKTFVRVIGKDEIDVSLSQDFIGKDGVRHPRNVLWLWSDDELWDVLQIRVDWVMEPSDMLQELDPIQIPKPPEPPLPVLPPDPPAEPLPPAPLAPPAAPAPFPVASRVSGIVNKIQDAGIEVDDDVLRKVEQAVHTDATVSTLVAYGGIAFRTLTIAKKFQYHQGHRHNYDHVTNLVSGSVLCEVEQAPPKRYDAPCQITISADHWHKFTALTDNVVYQCVYRQPERQDLYTVENSPYDLAPFTKEELIQKLKLVDNPCAHCSCDEVNPDVQSAT